VIEVSSTVDVAAPPADVWAVLARPDRIPEWNTLHRSFVAEPPEELTPGGGYGQRIRMMGVPMTVHWVVETADAPEHLAMRGSAPAGVTIDVAYRLAALDAGTRVELTTRFAGGPVDTPMAPTVAELAQRTGDQSLRLLASLAAPPS
jgi:uncharacterized protein YndB with AHSA1/START domain